MSLDDSRTTPAHVRNDGHNYHPTHRLVLFGHHFAAITGAGPLIGPVLAAQFGYAPGLIWLVAGVCLAGAVQDFIILWASTRRGGGSLAEIARAEIGPVAGVTTGRRDPVRDRDRAGRARPRCRQCLAGERLGHVHDRRIDSARAVHGPLHVPVQEGPDGRSHGDRRDWPVPRGDPREASRRVLIRHLVSPEPRTAHRLDGCVWLRRVGAAGLDAALPARLPQLVHEDRHDRSAHPRA